MKNLKLSNLNKLREFEAEFGANVVIQEMFDHLNETQARAILEALRIDQSKGLIQ